MKNNSLITLAGQIMTIRGMNGNSPMNAPHPLPLTYKSEVHTGAMIALFLPTSIGAKFVLNQPNATPLNELHITLAYLGKADKLADWQIEHLHEVIKLISEHHPPLQGNINGCGRFCNDDDGGDPFFIIPDLPKLPALRQIVTDFIDSRCEIEPSTDHGFTPHITLTYVPHSDPNPFNSVELTPITLPTISFVLADKRYDYPFTMGVSNISKAALIEKMGARHTKAENELIQKMHDVALGLGAECHPLKRKAGAKHSFADTRMIQRIHDDCAKLGAVCKALPQKDDLYHNQVMKEAEIIKAQSDAPNYKPASTPERCENCKFFLGEPGRYWCNLFDITADPDYICDDWEAGKPDEIPGYVANKGDLARLTEGVLRQRGLI